jgi:hypothetical protein
VKNWEGTGEFFDHALNPTNFFKSEAATQVFTNPVYKNSHIKLCTAESSQVLPGFLTENMENSVCKKFRLSRIDGLPPLMGGIYMNKMSELFTDINFNVAERLSFAIDKQWNITQECENYLFSQLEKTEIGHEQLSMDTMSGLFIVICFLFNYQA